MFVPERSWPNRMTCLLFTFVPPGDKQLIMYQRCRQLQATKGGVQAIVTGMKECSESVLVQERGLKLVVDTCLALSSCAEVLLQSFGGPVAVFNSFFLELQKERVFYRNLRLRVLPPPFSQATLV